MLNTFYIKIPKTKTKAFTDEIEIGELKPFAVKKDKNYMYAEFRFNEDISDIRVRYLLYASMVSYFNLGKSVLKDFNRVDDLDFSIMDLDVVARPQVILDIVETVEYTMLFKSSRTIDTFCKCAKIAKLNGHPAVLKVNKSVSGGLFQIIMSRQNTWSNMKNINDEFTAIAFTISAEEFDINIQSDVENIDVSMTLDSDNNNRIQRLQNKCMLLEDFTNLTKPIDFWEEMTLKFLLSRMLKIAGGQKFFKKQTSAMGLSADTYQMLEYMAKVYKAKNTYFKCSNTNCPHFSECASKKMYSTTELLFNRYEPLAPIKLLSVEEAKAKLKLMVYETMQHHLNYVDMAIIKVSTSMGKTTAYTEWVVEMLKNTDLRKINIIAVPTVKLAMQVKDTIDNLLEENGLEYDVYSVQELTPILEKLNPEALEMYEAYNKLGAYTRASMVLYDEAKKIAKKQIAGENISAIEKDFIIFMENKKIVNSLARLDAIYIVSHEWLSFQKEPSKFEGKTIIIDEDIFTTLNKQDSLKIKDLVTLEFKLEQMLVDANGKKISTINEALKLIRRLKDHFLSIVDYKEGAIPEFIKKEDGFFDITVIEGSKKINLTDALVDALISLNINSNILSFFECEYYMRHGDEILYNIRRDLYVQKFARGNQQKTKYILFSATADETSYRALFSSRKKTELMEIKYMEMGPVESKGKLLQLTNISASKTQLKTASEDGTKNIHTIIEKIKSIGGEHIKLLTYKDLVNEQVSYMQRFGTRKYDIDMIENMWLGNTAGYNDLAGQDLAILGSLRPPDFVLFLYAKSLGIELRQSGRLVYKTVEYNGFRFKFYAYENNEELNHLMMWLIDKENVQAAGRGRNRWNDSTTIIISAIPNPEATLIDDKIELTKPKFNKNVEDDISEADIEKAFAEILSSIE